MSTRSFTRCRRSYASLKDYEAQFLQETHTARGTRGASGTLYVKVPAKMRWDYAEPEEKHLITDGATSWMVLPGEKQAYTSPLDRSANARVPLQMLTGKLDFKRTIKRPSCPKRRGATGSRSSR
ncbi:MAG: outer membrane lipoprotein carrier protein LolA [Deltaproteobacteria bacterium]|nr:outer membrane lipoprotein carrier protein LolA [Deltaproteobacteria bacterium]